MEEKSLSVSELNKYIAAVFSFDEVLSDVYVSGEISNFKRHSSGHLYFSIKDDASKISCVMFKNDAAKLSFSPIDGSFVLIRGRVSVYEKSGQYQIYVRFMREDGIGTLYEQYNRLVETLREQGYFERSVKKPIPFYPKKIAVVTSPTGAAVRDMISVISRRSPFSSVIVCPVLVQGEGAGRDIAQMIDLVNSRIECDVIITGRGGGSIEELWAFNERIVAESIFKSKIPVISAVGHETDFTISDFVADLRAPTPSAAAELAVPDLSELIFTFEKYRQSLNDTVRRAIDDAYKELKSRSSRPVFSRPLERFDSKIVELDFLNEKLRDTIRKRTEQTEQKLVSLQQLAVSYSYEDSLRRGFCVLSDSSGIISADLIKESEKYTILTKSRKALITAEKITMREDSYE